MGIWTANSCESRHLEKYIWMLTLQTCRSLDICFLTLWGKHVGQSIYIYYLRCCRNCINLSSIVYLTFLIGVFNQNLSIHTIKCPLLFRFPYFNELVPVTGLWTATLNILNRFQILICPRFQFYKFCFWQQSDRKNVQPKK